MNYDFEKIGQRIREERKKQGKTQATFAADFEVKKSTVSRWENGEAMPSFQTLLDMCKAFDCEAGYLLCEEGYENRTRTATDICKATRLSEDAVNILLKDKKQGFISYFIENGKNLFATLGDYVRHERSMQELKKLPYWKVIEEAFDKVENLLQGDGRWIPVTPYEKDGTKHYELWDREELFYDVLEAGLNKYYDDTKISQKELEFLKSAVIATPEEKEKLFKGMEDTKARADEAMSMLQFGFEVYDLLKAEQKKKYYRYELSDNFMDLVMDYIEKEGAEDGK